MPDKPTTITYLLSGGLTAWGTLTVQEWAALIGALGMGATFFLGWYYKREHLKLAKKAVEGKEGQED